MRLIFEVKNHFSVRDEDSSEMQKRHLTHKTSRKDQGQIHVLFYIHTCTHIYIVFNKHHIYILAALSACAQLGDFQIWGVGFMKYIKMVKLEHSTSFKNSLIEMYSKPGDIDDARGVSYQNAMIQGLALHGLGEGALAQFHQMPDRTFMRTRYGISLMLEYYGCMFDLLCRTGIMTEAIDLIKKMPMEPNGAIWCMQSLKMSGQGGSSQTLAIFLNQKMMESMFCFHTSMLERKSGEEVRRMRKLMHEKGSCSSMS